MTAAGFTQIFDHTAALQAAGGANGEHALDVARAAFALRAEACLAPQDALPHHVFDTRSEELRQALRESERQE